jgi:PKD repeat protein
MPDGSIILMGGGTDIAANSGYKNDVWRYQPVGSSNKNPSHTFTTPGIYSVALQVFNSEGYDSTLKTRYVTVTLSPPVVNVPVKIVPKTINLGSKGVFLAFVTLPEAYKGATIDMKTVSCSGAPAVRMLKLKKFQKNIGFVFKTSDLKNVQPGKKVTLTVQGELKSSGKTYTFTGSDAVRVISKRGWQPDDIKDVSKESDEQLFNKYSEDIKDVPKKPDDQKTNKNSK